MINNRQAGRRRGRGGGGNGQRPGGNPGRPDNGNRIDNRARGNANQLYEKYKNLARDAHQQGDRVNTEYYLQFADHYFRVLSETRSRSEDGQQQQQRRPRDFVNGFDNDFDGDDDDGDEGEPVRAGEGGDEPRRDEMRREDGRRDEPRREEYRRDEPRREARRDGSRRDGRDGQGDDQQRRAGPPGERGHAGQAGSPDGGAPERVEPEHAVPERGGSPEIANDLDAADAPPEPRRRGRPRRERPVEEGAAVMMEADRLPPALSAGNDTGDAAAEAKPRRRRSRPPQDEAPAA